ncbi:serine/threonine-protein kinase [Marinicella litoralis]|uniref:Serine/threonine-protein kinase n=1 Tax=Marinicella litoralis TaxID=644220 RepID=A0A4R6XDM8_9GAMM|nr:serine/threonine-protein kinase [Marinicella litoralis]TDR17406.1 serine/threonine-protein kinase [Marinicella litoralis]
MNNQSFVILDEHFQAIIRLPQSQQAKAISEFGNKHPELLKTLQDMLMVHQSKNDSLETAVVSASQMFKEKSPVRIGSWRVLNLLGRGGMGDVYLAQRDDGEYERQVAIKLMRSGEKNLRNRFAEERQVLASLQHPNIATLLDGGQWQRDDETIQPYLVMEYVQGEDILSYANKHDLDQRQRLGLFLDLCAAVQFAHQRLIVHRDIKPANVLIDDSGQVKLLDFGIAKWIDEDQGHANTGSMTSIMTPQFASPEQLNGGLLTTATDVYALGVLLYHLLSGQGPHELQDKSIGEIANLLQLEQPTPLSRLNKKNDPAIDPILFACCQPDPANRYQSVSMLAEDIKRFINHEPILMRPPGFWQSVRLFCKRNTTVVTVVGIFSVALSLLLGFHLYRLDVEKGRVLAQVERSDRVSGFMVNLFDRANPMVAQGEAIDPKALLDRGLHEIDSELADEPLLQTQLYQTIGRAYLKLGKYPDAKLAIEKALSQMGGTEHEDVERLTSLHLLMADITFNLGNKEESKKHSTLAKDTAIQRFGGNHRMVATALTNLGVLACNESQFDVCLSNHQQALGILSALHGPDHDRVGTAHNYIAMAYDHQGLFDEAIVHYRKSLRILKLSFGELHPKVIDGHANLAGGLTQAGQTAEAKTLLDLAIKAARQVHASDSPELAGILLMKAFLHNQLEEYEQALPFSEEVLTIERKARGNSHPYVAYDLNLVGRGQLGIGRLDEAEKSFNEAVQIMQAANEKPDYILMTAKQGLGRVYNAKGMFEKAQKILNETWETRKTLDGPDSWVTVWTRYDLGVAADGLGDKESAKTHWQAVLDHATKAFPPGDTRTVKTQEALNNL